MQTSRIPLPSGWRCDVRPSARSAHVDQSGFLDVMDVVKGSESMGVRRWSAFVVSRIVN
jgi:hypothetical protein